MKTGVSARGDSHKVKRDFGFAVMGIVELRDFAADRIDNSGGGSGDGGSGRVGLSPPPLPLCT